MRVILADDHAIVRQGLRSLLESKADIEVIGEAGDGREALVLAAALKPDLVIMDIAMAGLNGLEALLKLQDSHPAIKVIILSMHVEENYVTRALRYGASGYVYKGSAYEDLELAMKAAQRGETFLSPAVSQVLINDYLVTNTYLNEEFTLDRLSFREREILQLIAEGQSRIQIADRLTISPKTVDRHKENLKDKLKIKREEELADYAKMLGMTAL
jgi:DNA-binding NarL/FixJ family response regulator